MTAILTHQSQLRPSARLNAAGWFIAGTALAFAVPYLLTSAWALNHDLYYACYFAAVAVFLGVYIVRTDFDLRAFVSANWMLSLGIGALAAAFVVFNVLSRDSTPHPSGAYFAFSIAWRGVIYGIVDALLLTAFPAAIALSLIGGKLQGLASRASFAGISLVLTLLITAVYHLGYEQFRDDGVAAPEVGNSVISVPTLVSANPVGSIVAHAAMHVAAVTHAYETDTFLPPQTYVD